ncbi:MAG: hypothetical protein EPO07_20040 [Verrucomicrobia bacterium]|nr:MAG: hypothetical protein EPO07_20040 [Verrucomicrobiota bacterium]
MSFAQKMVSGKITKTVACPKCGRPYEYEMKRTVLGKSSKTAATQAAAESEAAADADAKLKASLDSDCDLVSCPSCGAITDEMKKERRKFFGITLAGFGISIGGLLLIYLYFVFSHRILIVAAVLCGVCLLLSVVMLIIGITKKLVPRKGKS